MKRLVSAVFWVTVTPIAAGLLIATGDCFKLTDLGLGCDIAGAELLPGQCILSTTTNLEVNSFETTDPPGKTSASSSMTAVCLQTIGVLNGEGGCESPQGGAQQHTGNAHDATLGSTSCAPNPGG